MTDSTIEIIVNGERRRVDERYTLTALIATITGREVDADGRATDGGRLGVAVARNAEVVPRSQWFRTVLTTGDDLEIVTAVQGG